MLTRLFLYLKVFSHFAFYLFGTFAHEMAHWIVAKLTLSQTPSSAMIEEEDENGNIHKKMVAGFTIIPRITKTKVVYGHVLSIPRIQAAFVLIAIAPLVWYVALYYFLSYYNLLFIAIENGKIYLNFEYEAFLNYQNWLLLYISLQLLWAGKLSGQDIKVFFKGIFSISFLFIAFVGAIIYNFLNNNIILIYLKEVFG